MDHESNWKLNERWFKADKGRDSCKETTVEEMLSKDARAQSAASSALTDPGKGKGKGKGAADRHKSALLRVSNMASKLNKAVGMYEQKLPALRRSLAARAYSKLRHGLGVVRDRRDECLDELEDYKQYQGEENIEETIEKLTCLFQKLQEYYDTLTEAFQTSQPTPIKKDHESEQPEPSMDGGWLS